jgi:lipid-A-disaccharide synthase
MKYFLIAGEASGDMHAARLIEEIGKSDPGAQFMCMGGDLMQAAGAELIRHYRDMAFMGFMTVLRNLKKVRENFNIAEQAILRFQPDKVILVDYPGFNLRIARFVKEHTTLPVYYYISPKIWAWKTSRIHAIRRYVDHMLTIFPFETDFYARYDYRVHYVGNPSVDAISEQLNRNQTFAEFAALNQLPLKPVLAVLPGSRKQEIARCLPVILESLKPFGSFQIVVAGAPGIEEAYYKQWLGEQADCKVIFKQTYQLLFHSALAVVNSGTATLEAALIGTPQVVVYHVSPGWLASIGKKIFLKTGYISLVNILAGREVVRELVAHSFRAENLSAEVKMIIVNNHFRQGILDSYAEIGRQLGSSGTAARAARLILSLHD